MTDTELHTLAQDLYDGLTCAGIRTDLWPPAPGDPDESLGNRLEEAFCAISDYIAAVRNAERPGRVTAGGSEPDPRQERLWRAVDALPQPDPDGRPGVRIIDGEPRYSSEWL